MDTDFLSLIFEQQAPELWPLCKVKQQSDLDVGSAEAVTNILSANAYRHSHSPLNHQTLLVQRFFVDGLQKSEAKFVVDIVVDADDPIRQFGVFKIEPMLIHKILQLDANFSIDLRRFLSRYCRPASLLLRQEELGQLQVRGCRDLYILR